MDWSFLDGVGDALVGAIPNVLDNVTKKNKVTAPVVVEDQTPVQGDAHLTQDFNGSFLKQHWEKFAMGGLVLLGAFAYATKK
jgi:hypothetical protein